MSFFLGVVDLTVLCDRNLEINDLGDSLTTYHAVKEKTHFWMAKFAYNV